MNRLSPKEVLDEFAGNFYEEGDGIVAFINWMDEHYFLTKKTDYKQFID